jgi:hypothetical protein
MFGPDFYPTPGNVAARMMARISKDARYFLEPSAGKGNLAKAILGHGSSRWSRHSQHQVDVIESHPDLINALRANEELKVVGFDWLTYSGVSYYDAIVMNPPFSEGAAHLLRAWDFLHAGEIVCLLNHETIANPYTKERQRLAEIIAAHGSVEPLGKCFQNAERKTDVDVSMVYLKKQTEDDRVHLWATTTSEEKPIAADIGSPEMMPAIRDKLGNMEHFYNQSLTEMFKAIAHVRKASIFMEALGSGIESSRDHDDLGSILKLAQRNMTHARAAFASGLRKAAWKNVFEQCEFTKWLDTKQTEELARDVDRNSTIAFTADNIKATFENVFLQRRKLFEQSVWNVYEALTRHFKGNTTGDVGSGDGRSGWKTNDSYKVNKRLVFPYGCQYSYGSFDLYSRHDSGAIYCDLDRILAVLDGREYGSFTTVSKALNDRFRSSREPGTCESYYFKIRFFKKGTVHLEFKREDLRQAFNINAAAGRRWIGQNTQGE